MENSKNAGGALRLLLVLMVASVVVYTYFTMQVDGWNFFQATWEHLVSMQWKGQFTLDFLYFLLLTGLWIMWRNKYSSTAVFFGLMAMMWGLLFIGPYLIHLITNAKGDLRTVLLGARA